MTPPNNLPPNPSASTLRAALDNYDVDNGQTGLLAPTSRGWTFASGQPTADRLYLARFVPSRDMQVTKLTFCLTVAAGANDPCYVALYDESLATQLGISAATTGKLNGALGPQSVSLTSTVKLNAGQVYHAGFAATTPGGTAPSIVTANYTQAYAAQFWGTTAGEMDAGYRAASYPPPADASAGLASSSVGVVLAVRED